VISLVLFDLDDTLLAHSNAVAAGIGAYTGDPDAHVRWHELEELHYPRYLRGELDVWQQRRERVRDYLGVALDDAEADDWFAGYSAEYKRAWKLFPDAVPCLDALADREIGLITNGDLALQMAKIDAIALGSRVDHVIASGALGFAKPDPRIFHHACDLFGVAPAAALYVGDRLQTDAIGAAAAGLTGVWLDRSGSATADDLAAAAASGVRVIASLAELPSLVAAA
jgi:putative hydrolase of the HAD superfamily